MHGCQGVSDLISQRNLEIHFMPIVRLMSRASGSSWRNFAFEALVRGPEGHPLRTPGALFAAAEADGLRRELELLCAESALDHQAELPAETRLFVNVGLSTFLSPRFLDLARSHPAARNAEHVVVEVLEDEIPESSSFRERACALAELGYDIAMDDLTADALTLRRLIEAGPVRYWKLDRSVLKQWVDRASWVRNWLGMMAHTANQMGIEVVVEGIENSDLRHLPGLCEAGVTLGQGFVFGKPAILGPGLSRWRQGFCSMISPTLSVEAPPLVPVQLERRVRELLSHVHRLGRAEAG